MILKDAVCVVTGAASGLGEGISSKLLSEDAFVILIDIDETRLNLFAESHQNNESRFECHSVDVTDHEKFSLCIEHICLKYKRIDYFFNNAGIGGSMPFELATISHWNKIINLNLYGVVNGMKIIYPVMVKQGFGNIINTSSISGLIPFPGQVLYNTTKYAITGLTLSLVKEAEVHNIYLAIICPGMVKTRIFYKPIIGEEAPEEYVKIPKEAISVETAVEDIFKGISKKKNIIITPKFLKFFYFLYRLFGRIP